MSPSTNTPALARSWRWKQRSTVRTTFSTMRRSDTCTAVARFCVKPQALTRTPGMQASNTYQLERWQD